LDNQDVLNGIRAVEAGIGVHMERIVALEKRVENIEKMLEGMIVTPQKLNEKLENIEKLLTSRMLHEARHLEKNFDEKLSNVTMSFDERLMNLAGGAARLRPPGLSAPGTPEPSMSPSPSNVSLAPSGDIGSDTEDKKYLKDMKLRRLGELCGEGKIYAEKSVYGGLQWTCMLCNKQLTPGVKAHLAAHSHVKKVWMNAASEAEKGYPHAAQTMLENMKTLNACPGDLRTGAETITGGGWA
jgi:hypothetical protein